MSYLGKKPWWPAYTKPPQGKKDGGRLTGQRGKILLIYTISKTDEEISKVQQISLLRALNTINYVGEPGSPFCLNHRVYCIRLQR